MFEARPGVAAQNLQRNAACHTLKKSTQSNFIAQT
jgi:hypothetical protein